MANGEGIGSSNPEGKVASDMSPEQRLRVWYDSTPVATLVNTAFEGAENNPLVQQVAEANFQLGKEFYSNLSPRPQKPIPVGIDRKGEGETSRQRVMQYWSHSVKSIEGPTQYLEVIRGYRIGAEHDLWPINLDMFRLPPDVLAGRAERDQAAIQEALIAIVASSAQLNGAAQAALEERNIRHALLLAEAAGDFKPEGETVFRVSGQVTRKDETLNAISDFLESNKDDGFLIFTARKILGGIYDRQAKEQGMVNAFERDILPEFKRTE